MSSLHDLRVSIQEQYIELREILHSHVFEKLHALATEEEQLKVETMIQNFNVRGVSAWVKENDKRTLEDLNARDIRRYAMYYKIKYYAAMSKDELIAEIRRKQSESTQNEQRTIILDNQRAS